MPPALGKRLISAVVLAGFFLSSLIFFPPVALLVVLMVVSCLATLEFYSFLDTSNMPNYRLLGLAGGVALHVVTWLALRHAGARAGEWEMLVVLCVTLTVVLRTFTQAHNTKQIITMGGTLLGFLYVPFLLNFFVRLCIGWTPQTGRMLILYLLLVVKWTDGGAYLVGCAIGRHKMFPRISPAKSWEGFIGGMTFAVATSLIFYFCTRGMFGDALRFGLVDAVVLGLLLGLFGVLGDLAESLFKRAAGVKDSSRMIRGMGGVLDVVDSLLFTAPILYAYARIFLD